MRVRQIDSVKNKLLRDFKQKDKKVDIGNFSLLRMFDIYWGSNPTELAEGKRSLRSSQQSASDSLK